MTAKIPLRLKQGRTFDEVWLVELEDDNGNVTGPRDFTGLGAKASGWISADDENPAWTISTDVSAHGSIELGNGTIRIIISDDILRAQPVVQNGFWDLILIDNGSTEDFAEGPMSIERGKTQP